MHAAPVDVIGASGDVVRVASEALAGVLAVGARTRWKVGQVVLRDVDARGHTHKERERGVMSGTYGLRARVTTGVGLITRSACLTRRFLKSLVAYWYFLTRTTRLATKRPCQTL